MQATNIYTRPASSLVRALISEQQAIENMQAARSGTPYSFANQLIQLDSALKKTNLDKWVPFLMFFLVMFVLLFVILAVVGWKFASH
jgi:hypothetical protein